jgi:DNA-binding transcriptional regulator PaaX
MPSDWPVVDFSRFYTKKPNKHSLSSILCRLKKEGLVQSKGQRNRTKWFITRKGRQHLKKQTAKNYNQLRVLPEPDGIRRLITFDVPEKEYKKRDWLRAELLALEFKPLQKSVYLGDRPLPEEFIRDLEARQLGKCVHILSIEKEGTIK